MKVCQFQPRPTVYANVSTYSFYSFILVLLIGHYVQLHSTSFTINITKYCVFLFTIHFHIEQVLRLKELTINQKTHLLKIPPLICKGQTRSVIEHKVEINSHNYRHLSAEIVVICPKRRLL